MSFQTMAACPPPGGSRTSSDYQPLEHKRVKLDQPAKPDRKPRKNSSGDKQPNPLISPTEKCKVCGEPAAKHIHYGAVTCFSCRAFFRRSIQNQSCEAYKCRKQGSCEISLKSVRNWNYQTYRGDREILYKGKDRIAWKQLWRPEGRQLLSDIIVFIWSQLDGGKVEQRTMA